MSVTHHNSHPLAVSIVGVPDHPDFREAVALLRATAQCEIVANASPEVVVVAQARPGQFSQRVIETLQCRWPLAGIVAILGSWCEGETRTGRPWPSVKRFYWYEFPPWWRLQLTLRQAGHCPDWARSTTESHRIPPVRNPKGVHPPGREFRNRQLGLIQLSTPNRDTAEALADVLHHAGYATVWNPPGPPKSIVRGAVAGIWDGGQLDDRETLDLAAFCRSQAQNAAPVVALLDFPRRERCEIAKQLGVTTVLGKPWINAELVATISKDVRRDAEIPTSAGRAA